LDSEAPRQGSRYVKAPIVFVGAGSCICGFSWSAGAVDLSHPCWATPNDVTRILQAKNTLVKHAFEAAPGKTTCQWCAKEAGVPVHG